MMHREPCAGSGPAALLATCPPSPQHRPDYSPGSDEGLCTMLGPVFDPFAYLPMGYEGAAGFADWPLLGPADLFPAVGGAGAYAAPHGTVPLPASTPVDETADSDSDAGIPGTPLRPMLAAELAAIHRFIAAGPAEASRAASASPDGAALASFALPGTEETLHCVAYGGLHLVSGYDIIKTFRVLVFSSGSGALLASTASRKFEEGVFSVLRRLKVGPHCRLEDNRSDMLAWLHQNDCIRTVKKQKVYYWQCVDFFSLAAEIRSRCLSRAGKRGAAGHIPRPALALGRPPDPPRAAAPGSLAAQQALGLGASGLAGSASLSDFALFTDMVVQTLAAQDYPGPLPVGLPGLPDAAALHLAGGCAYAYGSPEICAAPFATIEPATDLLSFGFGAQLQPAGGPLQLEARQYTCREPGCARRFKRREHLKRHAITHTGERLFACSFGGCERIFSRGDNLRQHARTHKQTQSVG